VDVKVTILLLALLLPASAAAASPLAPPMPGEPLSRHRDLWATVNACDTEARPNRIGIRASMPGRGVREKLQMRFRVQFLDAADGRWRFVSAGADSGHQVVGTTVTAARQSGWDFRFRPPEGGGAHILRGHVTFTWRRRGRVTRRLREVTERGHSRRAGSDPPGYSASQCRIS
jgi:hypothetical protein